MAISKIRSRSQSFSTVSIKTFAALAIFSSSANASPASATTAAMKNLRLSLPVPLEKVVKEDFVGLNLEDASLKKSAANDAKNYINLRRGKTSRAQANAWIDACGKEDKKRSEVEKAFCQFELERRGSSNRRTSARSVDERTAILSQLRESKFENLSGKAYPDVARAVRGLSESEQYEIGKKIADTKECVASAVPTAIAAKLEESFPAVEAVELAGKLYRKSSTCSSDYAGAIASFRLGLLEIWQSRCTEIPNLMAKVETVPEASQLHSRAKFWRYYCANVDKNEGAKQLAKEALVKDHPMSFQTLAVVGTDETAMTQIIRSDAPSVAVRSIVRPDLNGFLRANEALIQAGAKDIAAEMVDKNVREVASLEPEVRLYVAVLMNRIGYALPKFKIMSELFQDSPKMVSHDTLRLYFPLWYYDNVRAKAVTVDPLLILSLIRQESAFNKEARSIVGARGLMQVMPATARSVQKVTTRKLSDPDTNITIGTKYFTKRLQQYDGDVELTLAAYNAGFARVDEWKRRYPTDNKLLFLEFIPFRETRDYVSSILRNYYWYVSLYSNEGRQTASVEGPKIQSTSVKELAIISANAGAAALTAKSETTDAVLEPSK